MPWAWLPPVCAAADRWTCARDWRHRYGHSVAQGVLTLAHACVSVLCGADTEHRRAIGGVAGVFEVIVGAMRRHGSVAEVQLLACTALGNQATGGPGSTAGVERSHSVPWCMVVGDGADAENRRAIGGVAGVFEVIVRAMRRHAGVAKVQQAACFALGQLAATGMLVCWPCVGRLCGS